MEEGWRWAHIDMADKGTSSCMEARRAANLIAVDNGHSNMLEKSSRSSNNYNIILLEQQTGN